MTTNNFFLRDDGTFVIPPASISAWSNTRLAKTANYTVANADKGATIALGGSAFYTLTFNAPSGYDANFAVMVINEDTNAAKTIALSGLASWKLWPGQSVFIWNSGSNVWKSTGPYRWILPAGTTFNTDHANGVDTNDGLSTGAGRALKTIGQAVNNIQAFMDLNIQNPVILNVAETFTENLVILGGFTGGPEITIRGNAASPSSVVWNANSAACVSTRDGTIVQLDGFTFTSGGASQAILVSQDSIVDFQNISFGAFAGGVHIQVSDPGAVANDTGGTYTVTGNVVFHTQTTNGGEVKVLAGRNVSVPNALTFTTWAYNQSGYTNYGSGVTFSGTGAAGGSTGKKYDVILNGVTILSGATLPGASAGTTATGGQASA